MDDVLYEILNRLRKIEQSKYPEFSDVKEFSNISGYSLSDVKNKLLTNDKFYETCVFRFEGSRKNYILTEKGIETAKQMMVRWVGMEVIKKLALMVLAATVLTTLAITVNWYSNIEKDNHYAEIYGIQSEGVGNNE